VPLRALPLSRKDFWDWTRASTEIMQCLVAWCHTLDILLLHYSTADEEFYKTLLKHLADYKKCLNTALAFCRVTGLNVSASARELQSTWYVTGRSPLTHPLAPRNPGRVYGFTLQLCRCCTCGWLYSLV
jgi:hypothetical protein